MVPEVMMLFSALNINVVEQVELFFGVRTKNSPIHITAYRGEVC